MWKNDIHLKSIDCSKFDLISVDLFDTLIFRSCANADDWYEDVYANAIKNNVVSDMLHPKVFKSIRKNAELRSKMKSANGKKEVTIEQIYKEMPDFLGKGLIDYEIELYKTSTYINPSMCSWLEYAHAQGKDIVLTCVTHLSESTIIDILSSCGFKTEILKAIKVSNKICGGKEELFKDLQSKSEQHQNNILYVSSSFMDDFSAGSNTVTVAHYNMDGSQYDIYNREALLNAVPVIPELTALRKLSASLCPYSDKENAFWFKLGAEVAGPILALSCGWVAECAVEAGIKSVYPLMREGHIFTKILLQIVENDQLDISVKPMYISRASAFMPYLYAISNDDEKFRDAVLSFTRTDGLTINEIFNMLETDELSKKYIDYGKLSVKEAEEAGVFEPVISDLLSDMANIKRSAQKRYDSLKAYIGQFSLESFATLDIGYNGTIPSFLNAIAPNGKHFLFFGKDEIANKIIDGTDIVSYGGYESLRGFNFVAYMFEQLLMCREGTTLGYDDYSRPILSQKTLYKIDKIEICHKGMLLFNKLFLSINKSIRKSIIDKSREQLAMILKRLYKLPTHDESIYVGDLVYDYNFGASGLKRIISQETIDAVSKLGAEQFLKQMSFDREVYWKEGAITFVEPNYLVRQMVIDCGIGYENDVLKIVQSVYNDNISKVVLYGAGEAGKKFISMLKLYDINVICIVDKNKLLHGSYVDCIEVTSLEYAIEQYKGTPFVVASFAYALEICASIRKYEENSKIYCYTKN